MTSKKRTLPSWMKLCESEELKEETKLTPKKLRESRLVKTAESFNRILSDSLKEVSFTGSLVYSHHKSDCNLLCEEIELALCDVTGAFIGFDMEWPVTYCPGRQEKTAVLQLCTAADVCYVFHLSCIGSLPSGIQQLILSPKILKVGVGIQSDMWKLERDYGLSVGPVIKSSVVDLSDYANQVLKANEMWSLDGLLRHLFGEKIDKNPAIRKSDWSVFPLSNLQKSYAATDAFVSYLIYDKLNKIDKKAV
ncbi:bifunctional 3'-5' exonuclease/ATP-dependent helicase WRN-like [Ostrea edulis]|uniref:bifunctional 3'-5' exonuclease/ATP-dependent helicase WRN-like n=1 Tax=Ostrea edulis TaxID=37623 RepID=UPI002096282E|nr:bifunctional 3'-5' exonuclease/ATP-dependent helicase WRN-like [Ostrea edulis]